MVTTIKITCDGVFIQSNSYLNINSGNTNTNNNNSDNININYNHTNSNNIVNSVANKKSKNYKNCESNNNYINANSLLPGGKLVIKRDIIGKDSCKVYEKGNNSNISSIRRNIHQSNHHQLLVKKNSLPSTTTLNIDVDVKRNRQQEGKKRYCYSIKTARRNSIGSAREEVMNSHTAAINLQSAGHRGFPQVASTTGNTSECPWYMPHQMPPTAPVRQHKRPAPQPGGGVSNVGNGNLLQQAVASTHSCTTQNSTGPPITHPHPPVSANVAHTVTTQQQQLQNVSMIPPQLPPHTANMNQNFNPTHLSTHNLSSQVTQQQQQHNTTNSSISPKSSNQQQLSPQSNNIHLMQSTAAVTNLQSTVNQQQQSLPLQQTSSNNITSTTPNLMSTSLNSVLLQNLTSVQSGNNGGGSNCNLGILGGSNNISGTQPPSINIPPIMSTSLHGTNFDSSNITWNTSSLSPTIPTQRKCEGKLNGMPWFHGSITREEAENLLQPREDGLFLVRESTNFPGDYTLCVCFQGKVEHYRVKRCNGKLTIDDEEFFEHLGQLVAHYENDADGLCTQLKRCLTFGFRPTSAGKEFEGWIIPEADIQLRDNIGKGEFGNVVLGIYKNEKVAVKMLKDDTAAQKFLQEASVMTTLEHENLVKFIGIVLTSHIYLVTEYMSKGSLVDYLRSRGRQHITKKDQINFACDTCSGMEYLENKKVIHRDLAARNVLISESCVAKVADFGLARGESYNLHVVKLPIKWTAPESLKEGKFSNKSDMWSFGILLWEIYSFGRVPYPRIPLDDVVRFVENNYKMEAPEGCPNEIYEMMKQAWDLNPARRPSFHELKPKLLNLKNMHTASELVEQK